MDGTGTRSRPNMVCMKHKLALQAAMSVHNLEGERDCCALFGGSMAKDGRQYLQHSHTTPTPITHLVVAAKPCNVMIWMHRVGMTHTFHCFAERLCVVLRVEVGRIGHRAVVCIDGDE